MTGAATHGADAGARLSPRGLTGESAFFPMAAGYRAVVVAAYLAYVVAAAAATAANHVPVGFVMVAALALFVAMRVLPLVLYRRDYGWFHPLVFGAVVALPNLLREFPAYVTGMQFHRALPGRTPDTLDRLFAEELALTALGLGFYYLGFFIPRVLSVPRLRFRDPRHLALKAMLTAGFAGVVLTAFIAKRGGLTAHVLSWARGRSFGLAGEGYWLYFAGLGAMAALLWFALDRGAPRSPAFWATAVFVSACSFLAAGSRGAVLYPPLLALLIWTWRERRIPVLRGVVVLGAGLLVLGALGTFRRGARHQVDWATLLRPQPEQGPGTGALAELSDRSLARRGTTAVLGKVPHEVDYIYGSSYLAVLTVAVPRKLWPAKPGLVGGRTGEAFFGMKAGMPPGTVGEAFWNFGYLGVPLVFFAFGMFHRWLARCMQAYPREPLAMCLYITVLYVAQPSTGGVMATLLRVVPLLGLAVAFGALTLVRRGDAAGAPATLSPVR